MNSTCVVADDRAERSARDNAAAMKQRQSQPHPGITPFHTKLPPPTRPCLTPSNKPPSVGMPGVLLYLAGGKKMAACALSPSTGGGPSMWSASVTSLSAPVMPPGGLVFRVSGAPAETSEARDTGTIWGVGPVFLYSNHCMKKGRAKRWAAQQTLQASNGSGSHHQWERQPRRQ